MNLPQQSGTGKPANKGLMASLFSKDQLPVPAKRVRASKKQTYDQRRISPVTAGVRVTSINPALTVMPGRVRLADLTSGDVLKQLSEFLFAYGRNRSDSFGTPISEETLRNRTDILFSTLRLVMTDKRCKHVTCLAHFKPRLLPRILELWTAKGISKRAQINYFSNVRWFWRICGIPIPPIASFEKESKEFTPNRNANRDKSWKGNGVDFAALYKQAYEMDPVAARLMLAMKHNGLRLKESLRLQPNEADGGDRLLVTKGTKTGRPRQLIFDVFEDQNFREVLDHLKSEVPEGSHLAWSNRSLKQAKARMHYIARKLGLTKNGLHKVTWHGLRADFAIDHLESLTGQKAPVRGGIAINYRELSAARLKVTQALGHNRLEITGAYYGSFLSLEREQLRSFTRSWERIDVVMKEVGQLILGSGVNNLYWIGSRSLGSSGATEPYEFAFPPGTDDAAVLSLAPQIAELVLGSTGIDCMVHNWKSLPGAKQVLWEADGTPIFESVSPLQYMQARLEEQKAARMKGGGSTGSVA
jgi:integrase